MQQRLFLFCITFASLQYASDAAQHSKNVTAIALSKQERVMRRAQELATWKGASPVMTDDEDEGLNHFPLFHHSKTGINVREEPVYDVVKDVHYDPFEQEWKETFELEVVPGSVKMTLFPNDCHEFRVEIETTDRFKQEHKDIFLLLDTFVTPYIRYYVDPSKSAVIKIEQSCQSRDKFYLQCNKKYWHIPYKHKQSVITAMFTILGDYHMPTQVRERRLIRKNRAVQSLKEIERQSCFAEEYVFMKNNTMKMRKVELVDNEEDVNKAYQDVCQTQKMLAVAERECKRYEKLCARCQ